MMTVVNEVKDMRKYFHLEYVEWLEMLCRLAHSGFNGTDLEQSSIAMKVEHVLKGIWAMFFQLGYWDKRDEKLAFIAID